MCCVVAVLVAATAPAAAVEITVRDSSTGLRVQATLRVIDGDGVAVEHPGDGSGRLELELAAGAHALVATAPGYRPLRTRVEGGTAYPLTVWLDPIARAAAAVAAPAGHGVIHGRVVDAGSGEPVAGAVLSLHRRGAGAVSEADGSFLLIYPVEPHDRDLLPPTDTLVCVTQSGSMRAIEGVFLTPGATRMVIDMAAAPAVVVDPPTHKMLDLHAPSQVAQAEDPGEGGPPPSKVLQTMWPPSSIRVGTGCSCTDCGGAEVMSLETYVTRGLNDEWIASWDGDSLRAGAVAYRSYGAWYVAHPLDGLYDICPNTCCQVNDADTHAATDAAVEATAGFMLERGGAVFRSEYSAENNAWDDPDDGLSCSNSDLSCGDGWAGSPSASWSCLADAPCAGHGCFGHGRGMCQWGTSRWADDGRAWPWIVAHYYNDHGAGSGLRTATMTSPMWIDAVAPQPPTVAAGGTFAIAVTATNAAELGHDAVLVGASLHSVATGYISDPPHDQPVTLVPGASTVWRDFQVPAATPPGLYDLLVSLYYDVNGDGNLTSADTALVLVTEAGAVSVAAGAIFADGFEAGHTGGWSATVP